MYERQKGIANIAVVIAIVFIIAAAGYFASVKLARKANQSPIPIPSLSLESPSPSLLVTPSASGSLTPIPDANAGWKTYRNTKYGLEFRHPRDLFASANVNETPTTYLGQSAVRLFEANGRRGAMGALLIHKKFDPINIQDTLGPAKGTPVKLGDRPGYIFTSGDSDCSSQVVQAAWGDDTLRVAFAACAGDPNRLDRDDQLITQILSTFRFAK